VQRDTYKYLHDQTVRLFNQGLTPGEIAEELELPASLQTTFHNRGYYGTTRHNARAVYQDEKLRHIWTPPLNQVLFRAFWTRTTLLKVSENLLPLKAFRLRLLLPNQIMK
jgi:hypothetical protein